MLPQLAQKEICSSRGKFLFPLWFILLPLWRSHTSLLSFFLIFSLPLSIPISLFNTLSLSLFYSTITTPLSMFAQLLRSSRIFRLFKLKKCFWAIKEGGIGSGKSQKNKSLAWLARKKINLRKNEWDFFLNSFFQNEPSNGCICAAAF